MLSYTELKIEIYMYFNYHMECDDEGEKMEND